MAGASACEAARGMLLASRLRAVLHERLSPRCNLLAGIFCCLRQTSTSIVPDKPACGGSARRRLEKRCAPD